MSNPMMPLVEVVEEPDHVRVTVTMPKRSFDWLVAFALLGAAYLFWLTYNSGAKLYFWAMLIVFALVLIGSPLLFALHARRFSIECIVNPNGIVVTKRQLTSTTEEGLSWANIARVELIKSFGRRAWGWRPAMRITLFDGRRWEPLKGIDAHVDLGLLVDRSQRWHAAAMGASRP